MIAESNQYLSCRLQKMASESYMSHKATIQEQFEAAVNVIQSLPKDGPTKPSHETMLTFYGLFKQAKLGPCNVSQPGFWDVVGRAKWNAWKKLGNMPKETAMKSYVNELKKTIENAPSENGDVTAMIGILGNFYELLDESEDDSIPIRLSESDESSNNSPTQSKAIRDSLRMASKISSEHSPNRLSPNQSMSHNHFISNGDLKNPSKHRLSSRQWNSIESIDKVDNECESSDENYFDSMSHFTSSRLPSPYPDLSNLSAAVEQMETDVKLVRDRLATVEQSLLRHHHPNSSLDYLMNLLTSKWSLLTLAIAWPVVLQLVVMLYMKYKRSRR